MPLTPCHLAYAYPRRAKENLHGRVHVRLDSDLPNSERLDRVTGDALCKRAEQFWSLADGEDDLCAAGITCTPCAERYERLVAAGVLAPHGFGTSASP